VLPDRSVPSPDFFSYSIGYGRAVRRRRLLLGKNDVDINLRRAHGDPGAVAAAMDDDRAGRLRHPTQPYGKVG
jgi:hypothetical protein